MSLMHYQLLSSVDDLSMSPTCQVNSPLFLWVSRLLPRRYHVITQLEPCHCKYKFSTPWTVSEHYPIKASGILIFVNNQVKLVSCMSSVSIHRTAVIQFYLMVPSQFYFLTFRQQYYWNNCFFNSITVTFSRYSAQLSRSDHKIKLLHRLEIESTYWKARELMQLYVGMSLKFILHVIIVQNTVLMNLSQFLFPKIRKTYIT